ncbi:MAG: hypothetical protein NTX82_00840 [Candidatus Parcubacteria bacterium]|nr:hypothetical protein [Candidatus Parcubacteria bacterium]
MVNKESGEQVKGTWLVDWAKMINKYIKDHPDQKDRLKDFLTAEDLQELKVMILPGTKYPYAFFRRLGRAVFYIVAQGNLQATRLFGRLLMKNLLQTYKNMLTVGNPIESAKKLVDYHKLCFINVVSKTNVIKVGEKSITISLTLTEADKKFEEAATALAWQLGGQFEELVTQAGAQNVKLQISKTPDNNYEYSLEWE